MIDIPATIGVCDGCHAPAFDGDEHYCSECFDVARSESQHDRDSVYEERDRLVAALSKCYSSHLARHSWPDWEDDWRNIVCVHLPTGQAAWHIHDSELDMFEHLAASDAACFYDGHSTEEKYARLARAEPEKAEELRAHIKRWSDNHVRISDYKREKLSWTNSCSVCQLPRPCPAEVAKR